jgi:peptide/nickel transport system substrate-binding protein
MLAGGIDVMVEIPPDSVASFEGGGFTLHEQAGPHLWFLILNTKEGPFAEKSARQAVNYAIDKQALVEQILQGTAEVATGPTPPPSPGPITTRWSLIPTIRRKRRRCSRKRARPAPI